MKITKIIASVFLGIPCLFVALLVASSFQPAPPPKRAAMHNDVIQIATAVVAYEDEYGHLPSTNGVAIEVGGELLLVLMGKDENGKNPRRIVFLEVSEAKKGWSGQRDGKFVDPHGVPYQIALDGDYNNEVRAGRDNVVVKKKVAVWNSPDKWEGVSELKKKRGYITSWE